MISIADIPVRKCSNSVAAQRSRQRRLNLIEDATAVVRYAAAEKWIPLSVAANIAQKSAFEQKLGMLLHAYFNNYETDAEFRKLLVLNCNSSQRAMLINQATDIVNEVDNA